MIEAGPARDLGKRLAARIRSQGPISVAAFMSEALHDPRAGYYATKDPIGAGADYITAPEISQMFGELVGLWLLQTWLDMGSPAPFRLIELGPGRGTMMSDVLRAANVRPEFAAAARVSLVETSPALRAIQAQTLAAAPAPVEWTANLEDCAPGPALIFANEFLDCLPIRQFVRANGGWRERLVGLSDDDGGEFEFMLSAAPASPHEEALIPAPLRDAPEGSLIEIAPGVEAICETLASRFADGPGRSLIIDYGPAASQTGDTFQAVHQHKKVSPLEAPGERDLTAHVDFAALKHAAETRGLVVHGPAEQGPWLKNLGLETRAAALMRAQPDKKSAIARQVLRLTGDDEMGRLFKVMCISAPDMPALAGF